MDGNQIKQEALKELARRELKKRQGQQEPVSGTAQASSSLSADTGSRSSGQTLLDSFNNEMYAASQRTSPVVRDLTGAYIRTPLGEAREADYGMVMVDPESGKWTDVDPKSHVVLFDEATGKNMVFARTETTDESVPVSLFRLFSPGLATAPPAGAAVASRAPAKPASAMAQNVAAMERAGITPNLMNSGPRSFANAGQGIGSIPVAGAPAAKALQQNVDEFANAVTDTAKVSGPITSRSHAGQSAVTGIQKTLDRARDVFDKRYSSLGIPKGARTPASKFKRAWAEVSAKTDNPVVNELLADGNLKKLADSLGEAETFDTLRQVRTLLRKFKPSQESAVGTQRTDVNRLYDALTEDLTTIAAQYGKADDLKQLDALYGRYQAEIKAPLKATQLKGDILKNPRAAPESVYDDIIRMAKDKGGANERRLATTFRAMGGEARGEFTATLIERMGKATAAGQDAAGETFSASRFMTEWNSLTPRAKSIIFGQNRELRNALDSLVAVGERMKEVERAANYSNTANNAFAAGAVTGGFGTFALFEPATALLSAATPNIAARILSSPRAVRWLSGYTKAQASALQTGVKRGAPGQITPLHQRQLSARLNFLRQIAERDEGAQLLLQRFAEAGAGSATATEQQ